MVGDGHTSENQADTQCLQGWLPQHVSFISIKVLLKPWKWSKPIRCREEDEELGVAQGGQCFSTGSAYKLDQHQASAPGEAHSFS